MKLNAMLLCTALVALGAAGCGGDGNEGPAADSLGVDTATATVPMDTTSALDSMNAPVTPDTTADSATAAARAREMKKPADSARGVSVSVDATVDTATSSSAGSRRGGSTITSGVRRGTETSAGAEGRRGTGDTSGTGTARRR